MFKNYNLERCIVWLLVRGANEKGWSQAEFARRAMPDRDPRAAQAAWMQTRRPVGKTGKAQRLGVSEAISYAETLGTDIQLILFKARDLVERGWTEETAPDPLDADLGAVIEAGTIVKIP